MSGGLRRRRVLGGLALAPVLGLAPASRAQTDAAGTEYRVKAAFLVKFIGYVGWPEGAFATAEAPFVIGVIGADALAAELARLADGRKVNERSLMVKQLKAGESPSGVHLLFVGGGEPPHWAALAATLQARPVLVVTEAERAIPPGSAINFVLADRRVRFEIVLDAAEKAGLRLSSRLLAVAQKVHSGVP